MKRAPTGYRTSVAQRLLIASLLLVMALLPIAGTGLAYSFRESVTTAFDERLKSLIDTLLASVQYDPAGDALAMVRPLGDSRFDRVFSGWYWQIDRAGERALASRSLWDQTLAGAATPVTRVRDAPGPRGQSLRVISRTVQLPRLAERVTLRVALPRSELDAELRHFERLLWLSLLSLGVLLLAGLALQIRWGLSPLRRLRSDLQRVREGEAERLDEALPRELAELAAAMNGVLRRDRRRVERGRAAAGNLAHALKTPISVLQTLSESMPEASRAGVRTELDRLDAAVRHHLARASAAGDDAVGARVDVGSALAPVVAGLSRLAERRGLTLDSEIGAALRVRADAQDLQEMVGNLLENAVNWARTRVTLRAFRDRGGVTIRVGDDGPGMPADARERAMRRGERLDQRQPGSGLGLAVVADLVALYDGELTLDGGTAGGLTATLWLPSSAIPPAGSS